MTTHMKMHHPCIDLSVRKKNIPHSQLRLQDAVRVKMSVNSPQALNISRAIGKFIATDLRPFSMVESAGFKLLLSAFEPRHQLPSRTYFSDNIIPELILKSWESLSQLRWYILPLMGGFQEPLKFILLSQPTLLTVNDT